VIKISKPMNHKLRSVIDIVVTLPCWLLFLSFSWTTHKIANPEFAQLKQPTDQSVSLLLPTCVLFRTVGRNLRHDTPLANHTAEGCLKQFRPTNFQPPHPRPWCFLCLLGGGDVVAPPDRLQELSGRHCRCAAVLCKTSAFPADPLAAAPRSPVLLCSTPALSLQFAATFWKTLPLASRAVPSCLEQATCVFPAACNNRCGGFPGGGLGPGRLASSCSFSANVLSSASSEVTLSSEDSSSRMRRICALRALRRALSSCRRKRLSSDASLRISAEEKCTSSIVQGYELEHCKMAALCKRMRWACTVKGKFQTRNKTLRREA